MLIETVGLDQYAPGGSARVQVLIAGGPGVGKTRMSSFFPKPIYADCEDGMGSVADRGVQRARIRSFRDMVSLLALLKQECRKPPAQRQWETLVVDTVDAYQRLVMEEWHEQHPNGHSNKYEVWNHLARAMSVLTTRALNLDMNVVMLVHESTKTDADDNVIHGLQLKGGQKEEIFNDFDLVGWMRTEWAAIDGERQQRRLLTFHPRPGREWLKDRLHITKPEYEVTFSENDYTQLFSAVLDNLDAYQPTEVVGEVPMVDPDAPEAAEPTEDVVPPGVVEGALPPAAPAKERLDALTKPELIEKAGELGAKVSGSMKKDDLIAAVEQAQAQAAEDAAPVEQPSEDEPAATPEAEAPAESTAVCEDCGKDLAGEDRDQVKIAWIKFRMKLCNEHFQTRKG